MADFMRDQADGLRRMLTQSDVRMVSMASGCPGAGRSTAVINIAAVLAGYGRKVLVIDENDGASGGSQPSGSRTYGNGRQGARHSTSIEDALVSGPRGVSMLALSAFAQARTGSNRGEQERALEGLRHLTKRFDFVLVDTCSGGGAQGDVLSASVLDTVIVTSAASQSITGAYALIKHLHHGDGRRRFHVLLNCVGSERDARVIFGNMQRVAFRHLATSLQFLGHVPRDERLRQAACRHQTVVEAFPSSPAATAFRRVAESIANEAPNQDCSGGLENWMQSLLNSRLALANAGV